VPRATRRRTVAAPAEAARSGRSAEVLRAARAVLVEEGYAALTTRKIAQRLGMRQSNVQYYFPSKTELVRALFEQAVADDRPSGGAAPGPSSPLERMLASVDQFLAKHDDIKEQAFLRELWALSAHDPEVAAVMSRFYQRWIEIVARNILATTPELGRKRAEQRALLVISLVDGLSLFHGAAGVEHRALDGIERELRSAVRALVTQTDLESRAQGVAAVRRNGPALRAAAPVRKPKRRVRSRLVTDRDRSGGERPGEES
jgi:AcrR family transcriptional regulator